MIEGRRRYWADVRDPGTRAAITWRDPRAGVAAFDETPPPRFAVGDRAAYAFLEEHGYVVFAGALDGDETDRATALFWDFMEARASSDEARHTADASSPDAAAAPPSGRVRRDDVASWHWATNPINGLLGVGGVGQSDFLWYARGADGSVESGDAAAATWIVRGGDAPAPPRPRRRGRTKESGARASGTSGRGRASWRRSRGSGPSTPCTKTPRAARRRC